MSSEHGTTQPALPPASDQEMQREKIRHLPAPARKERTAGEHRGRMGSPVRSGVGSQAGGAHERPGGLWGMKRIQSTHPVL